MGNEKSTAKKIFAVIGNVIIWVFVIFAAVVTVFTFAAQSSADGIPSIGGNAILTVQTDSMVPEFYKGDIIIAKKLLPEEIDYLKVGDVITYDAGDLDGDGMRDLNSHRIVEIIKDDNGEISYITKGDNNLVNDSDSVAPQNVICKYDGTKIKGVGKLLNFLQTPKGFLAVIVIPLILFFIFELIRFIRKFIEIKNADSKQITAEDEERIRRQAVEEYLRSQGTDKDVNDVAEAVTEQVAETAENVQNPVETPEDDK